MFYGSPLHHAVFKIFCHRLLIHILHCDVAHLFDLFIYPSFHSSEGVGMHQPTKVNLKFYLHEDEKDKSTGD